MSMHFVPSAMLAAGLLLSTVTSAAGAQHEGHAMADSAMADSAMADSAMSDSAMADSAMADSAMAGMRGRWHLMAQAIPVVTHATHSAGSSDVTEAYLAQAAAMARGTLFGGHLQLAGTFNAEGLTMKRGELSTGAFGEGYVDRRHPHTYLHEIVATGVGRMGQVSYSASVGRGFAPFGTDDPMMRPFEKYPINHHLAQILERPLAIAAVRWGGAIVEGSTFAGDEPTSPSSSPHLRRFGDSWAVRGTLLPLRGVEMQGSYASVASPEEPRGFGLDQRKRSVSGRYLSPDGARYLLVEWERTVEVDPARDDEAFAYESALAEGALSIGPISVALRLEQTDRPEEERLADPFRTPRPATDLAIAGITRWRSATAAVTLPAATLGPVRGYPFVEVERLTPSKRVATSVFDPAQFYGNDAPWMASFGVRIRIGPAHARMGRYGVALPDDAPIRALGADRGGMTAMDHH
jgi:hypothetical protein